MSKLRNLLLLAVFVHLAFAVARLPHAAFAKRWRLIGEFEQRGPIGYHVGRSWPEAAAVLEELARELPPDAVLLWRGDWRGLVEFAPPLLWPRVLYAESAVTPSATAVLGRPIARRAGRQLVLVAEGKALRVVPR